MPTPGVHPAQPPAAGAVADGGDERQAEAIRLDGPAVLQVAVKRFGDVSSEVDEPIAALAAYQ
jgi:hypothetical protein